MFLCSWKAKAVCPLKQLLSVKGEKQVVSKKVAGRWNTPLEVEVNYLLNVFFRKGDIVFVKVYNQQF